ncbi:MAG TPA: hypothetical protein VMI54_22490 [Polyangiaceae bacterium]|nr:hypothetical protein [Polyangiaceae bacterium]
MKHELTYALCAAFVLGLASGCSQGPTSQNVGTGTNGDTGTINVALSAAPGVTLDAVGYVITGPSSFSKSGSLDVSHAGTISATLGGLPAGNGFSITLTASSTDGVTSCSGSAAFNVTAQTTTPVSVHLVCHGAATTGSVLVNGSVNVCPQIDGLGATPTEVLVGGSVALTSTVHDADGAPSPLAYSWSASSGTVVNPTAANTRFICTAPGAATVTLGASDGDSAPGCAASASITVNCTAQAPATACALGNGAGPIKHVIYLQFDNTHLQRDRTNVPSDLEQMPHLLGFIRGNGTLMANDHTILISHTAGGILSTLTGVYPDRTGQVVSNSFVRTSNTGTFTFPSSFGYWTDPVASGTSIPNMVAPDGSNVPAPWVAYTRAGCDVGGVGSANMVLENTGTSSSGDIFKVFGSGSPQFAEATASNAASSGSAARNLAQTDFVGFAIHCAQGSATCAGGQDDLLPGEPGGYTGFKGLFGAQAIDPLLTGQDATHPLTSLLGNPITDPFGQPGFPGFDGMEAEVSLAYVAALQEHGVPVTYAYISDAHDFHGVAGNAHNAYGPGDPGYVAQLAAYDQAFDAFFTNLAAHGIDKTNTLFIVTVDEGDHFVGGQPSNPSCDGVTVPCNWPANTVGELQANIDTLVTHQFPTLAAKFLGSGPNAFTVHGDDAPPFYLAKKGTGGGPLGQTDPDTRDFERQIATITAVNSYTGVTEPMLAQMVDQTGAKAIHMYTTGDPLRNGTFTFFADADYFITDYPTNTCETCIGAGYAWNHGDIQSEIGHTWIGFVGPGVASQPDQMVFTDHTDVRQTINALTGLPDSYEGDGRVITQALVPAAIPGAIATDKTTFESLADAYKSITAPFGQFAADMIVTSTKALKSNDPGDATYTAKEASIASLTAQRDALVVQIRDAFDLATYAGTPIDGTKAAGWISQAQALLTSADALAAAP